MKEQTTMTRDEWMQEGRRRFGDDVMNWRFVCPACGHVAAAKDWKDAGAPEGAVAFSCVGRYAGCQREAFGKGAKEKGPCNYAGGGLFAINPVEVNDAGVVTRVFAFDNDTEGRPLRYDDAPGTTVAVTLDDGTIWHTRTRSETWLIGDRRVVLLEGRAGGYAASRCKVVEVPEPSGQVAVAQ